MIFLCFSFCWSMCGISSAENGDSCRPTCCGGCRPARGRPPLRPRVCRPSNPNLVANGRPASDTRTVSGFSIHFRNVTSFFLNLKLNLIRLIKTRKMLRFDLKIGSPDAFSYKSADSIRQSVADLEETRRKKRCIRFSSRLI
jgi:hypothetical protein